MARSHPVRGWDRDLPDGRVELFGDGPTDAVEAYLDEVRERMAAGITSVETTEREADEGVVGFRIVA